MKKIGLFFISLVGCFSICGCGQGGEVPVVVKEDSLNFGYNDLNLVLGDEFKVSPISLYSSDETAKLTYKSLDTSIIEVSLEGLIVTKKVGETIIEASYGKAKQEINVNVNLGDINPVIRFSYINSDEININTNTDLDIKTYVDFNFHKFDFECNVKVDHSNMCKIENNILTPLMVGDLELTVSGTFFGVSLTPIYLNIHVVEDVYFYMTENNNNFETSYVNLKSIDSYKGETYKKQTSIRIYAVDNSIKKENVLVSIEDSNIATLNNNLVTGISTGTTYLIAKYTNNAGISFVKKFPVIVDEIIVDYDGGVVETDEVNGRLPNEQIFKDFLDKEIIKATSLDGEIVYDVINGQIHGLTSSELVQKIIIYNHSVGFIIDLSVYTLFIETASDLEYFNMQNVTDSFKGRYVLANDIDASDYIHMGHVRLAGEKASNFPKAGLLGTFDGRGHTISNITFARGGLFGNVGQGGTIKNLGLKNVKFSKGEERYSIATYINGGYLQNIYVQANAIEHTANCALLAHNIMINSTVKNCLFVLDDTNDLDSSVTGGGIGSFTSYCLEKNTLSSANEDFLKDTYVISLVTLTRFLPANKEYVDTFDYSKYQEKNYTRYTYPNVKHYLTQNDLVNAKENFSSFSSQYWEVRNNMLYFK